MSVCATCSSLSRWRHIANAGFPETATGLVAAAFSRQCRTACRVALWARRACGSPRPVWTDSSEVPHAPVGRVSPCTSASTRFGLSTWFSGSQVSARPPALESCRRDGPCLARRDSRPARPAAACRPWRGHLGRSDVCPAGVECNNDSMKSPPWFVSPITVLARRRS